MSREATINQLAAAVLITAALSAGCQSPGATQGDCTIATPKPAQIFALEAPGAIAANAAFTIKAWTVLFQAVGFNVQSPKPDTYRAVLDESKTILNVTGQVNSPEPNPIANCEFPAVGMMPKAEPVEVQVEALPAGTYDLQIQEFPSSVPTSIFTSDKQIPSPAPRTTIEVK